MVFGKFTVHVLCVSTYSGVTPLLEGVLADLRLRV